MGRRANARRAIEVLEATYSEAASPDAWCARISELIEPLVTDDSGVVTSLLRRRHRYEVVAHGTAGSVEPWTIEDHRAFLAAHPPEDLAFLFEPTSPIVRCYSEVASIASPEQQAYFDSANVGLEVVDMIGIFGRPTRDTLLAIGARRHRTRRPDPLAERRLTQLGLHMENAARLHVAPREAIAIVEPSGRVVHLAGALDRARLAHGVNRIEHIRAGSLRAPSSEHLDLWKGLVSGAYSLVERIESDGRRSYLVYPNLPARHPMRAFTAREASVLELSARGLTGKWIAYSLGLSMTTVSEALAAAAAKAGARSRTRVVALAASLLGGEAPPAASLTAAEHAVVADVVAGLSNAQIAARRGSSVRTVANQIASILRKTGTGSRRALAARASTLAPPPATAIEPTRSSER